MLKPARFTGSRPDRRVLRHGTRAELTVSHHCGSYFLGYLKKLNQNSSQNFDLIKEGVKFHDCIESAP
jgi:hypothetical protein